MSKFCTSCGASLDDNATFCTSCGAKLAAAPQQTAAPVYQSSTEATASDKTPLDSLKEKFNLEAIKNNPNKNAFIAIGAIAIAVILILVLLLSIFGDSYKKPIKNYFKAVTSGDVDKYVKALPEFITKDSNFKESTWEKKLENKLDKLEKEFGDDVKISYSIKDKEKLSKSDLKEAKAMYILGFSKCKSKTKFSKGYLLELELKIKGDDDEIDDVEAEACVMKIDGDWCLMYITCGDYPILNLTN